MTNNYLLLIVRLIGSNNIFPLHYSTKHELQFFYAIYTDSRGRYFTQNCRFFFVCQATINHITTLGDSHARIWQVFFTNVIKHQILLQQIASAAD